MTHPGNCIEDGDGREDAPTPANGGFAGLSKELLAIHSNKNRARRNTVIGHLGRWLNENGLVVAAGLRMLDEKIRDNGAADVLAQEGLFDRSDASTDWDAWERANDEYRERCRAAVEPHLRAAMDEVERAERGSAELDAVVSTALGIGCDTPITTSLGAAMLFAEAVFPGVEMAIYTNWPIRTTEPHNCGGWRYQPNTRRGVYVRFHGQPECARNSNAECWTAPLAVCGALLSARDASYKSYPYHAHDLDAGRHFRLSRDGASSASTSDRNQTSGMNENE